MPLIYRSSISDTEREFEDYDKDLVLTEIFSTYYKIKTVIQDPILDIVDIELTIKLKNLDVDPSKVHNINTYKVHHINIYQTDGCVLSYSYIFLIEVLERLEVTLTGLNARLRLYDSKSYFRDNFDRANKVDNQE